MKLRNTKRVKSDEASKFVKKEEPSEIGTFVKRKKAVTKTIEKTVTVSAKSSKAKKTNLRLDDDEDSIVDNKSNVDSEVILKALDVLQELNRIFSEKRNELFDDNKTIILQIECVKIPDCVSRKLRLFVSLSQFIYYLFSFKKCCLYFFRSSDLPHWLITDTSDICLFVTDLKKGRRVDHEPTIQHYEDLLREKGITMVIFILLFFLPINYVNKINENFSDQINNTYASSQSRI